MSEFRFICPFCDAPLDCPEELDGVETECPICNEKIVPVSQPINKISVTDENNEESEEQKKLNYGRLKSELNEQKEQERDIPRLEIEIPIKNQSVFIAKCPACKKVIELEEELKYSKQQCPFCNKTVLLNTVKNQNNNQSPRPIKTEKEKVASKIISESIKFNDYLTKNTPNIFVYVVVPLASICSFLLINYTTIYQFEDNIATKAMYSIYNLWTGAEYKEKKFDEYIQRTRTNFQAVRDAKEKYQKFQKEIYEFYKIVKEDSTP